MTTVAETIHVEQKASAKAPNPNEGKLTVKGEEKSVTKMEAENSADVLNYLSEQAAEEKTQTELPELAEQHEIYPLPEERPEIEQEIADLYQELGKSETPENKQTLLEKPQQNTPEKLSQQSLQHSSSKGEGEKIVHKNIFDMAGSLGSPVRLSKEAKQRQNQSRAQTRPQLQDGRVVLPGVGMNAQTAFHEQLNHSDNTYDRPDQDREQEDEQEGFADQQQQQEREQKEQKGKSKPSTKIFRKQANTGAQASKTSPPPLRSSGSHKGAAGESLGGIENIFIRFMALMARILGQAEAEAHNLYTRIKSRTDNIDLLTLLMQKINSSSGAIDWTNNEEMKQLINRARELGVDIPEGKYKWNEDEKKLLKENIQMRKDSMEKITQLERTDMQRFLQEASQCHQARSNVLKLLKEVMDTITHNMRP